MYMKASFCYDVEEFLDAEVSCYNKGWNLILFRLQIRSVLLTVNS